jgi:hypothetical protein
MEFEFRWAIDEGFSNRRVPIIWLFRPDKANPKMFLNFFDDSGGCGYDVNMPGVVELRC